MMTKKHFEEAAAMLRRERQRNTDIDTLGGPFSKIEDFLVDFFRNDNPRFNEQTFRKACQP